ncbi:hypothetical protein NPX13_g10976 [Xylaria arbuscula]|uniref:Uncharacterized protein n=1 Tax=Xylaria arbuscula TaxID=114810 RepID=A0A9W8N3J3_9PEZI|nr:hypothetical protein NPX13_g10976 [Xylaria arbuscula]
MHGTWIEMAGGDSPKATRAGSVNILAGTGRKSRLSNASISVYIYDVEASGSSGLDSATSYVFLHGIADDETPPYQLHTSP